MFTNGALAVSIERLRKPDRAAIRQRAEASVEMIKALVHQFDRNHEVVQQLGQEQMRLDVRAKPVTAKQNVTAKETVALAFKNELGRQLHYFEPVLGKPTLEMTFFAPPFLVTEAAENESLADHQPCVRGKHQIRQTRLGRQQIDLATERSERVAQRLPLNTRQPWFCIPRPAHPGIDLVFNAVVIRRAEQQPAHRLSPPSQDPRQTRSVRAGTAPDR